MIFGQGFNDLFVIRVAGNVLGDVCLGSIDFAVNALSESVKVVVMLGMSAESLQIAIRQVKAVLEDPTSNDRARWAHKAHLGIGQQPNDRASGPKLGDRSRRDNRARRVNGHAMRFHFK